MTTEVYVRQSIVTNSSIEHNVKQFSVCILTTVNLIPFDDLKRV